MWVPAPLSGGKGCVECPCSDGDRVERGVGFGRPTGSLVQQPLFGSWVSAARSSLLHPSGLGRGVCPVLILW